MPPQYHAVAKVKVNPDADEDDAFVNCHVETPVSVHLVMIAAQLENAHQKEEEDGEAVLRLDVDLIKLEGAHRLPDVFLNRAAPSDQPRRRAKVKRPQWAEMQRMDVPDFGDGAEYKVEVIDWQPDRLQILASGGPSPNRSPEHREGSEPATARAAACGGAVCPACAPSLRYLARRMVRTIIGISKEVPAAKYDRYGKAPGNHLEGDPLLRFELLHDKDVPAIAALTPSQLEKLTADARRSKVY
eukprot:gene642-5857_t